MRIRTAGKVRAVGLTVTRRSSVSTKHDIERDVQQAFKERERSADYHELRTIGSELQWQAHDKSDLYFNYDLQVWVRDGKYVRCGHLTPCRCYGRKHEGEQA